MMTDKELRKLTLLMTDVHFDRSAAAQDPWYLDLMAQYDKLRGQLCDKLDDRRLEMFEELMRLRDQIEYEHVLHYLKQGIFKGVDLADKIELPGKPLILT